MKLRRVSPKREKYLWIPLTLMLLASIAMVSAPVKSQEYQTRLYIRESPPGSWIPGVPVGQYVWVTVDIEIPFEWDNTIDGVVAWVFSVHVDPDVLTPVGVYGAFPGFFLCDFTDWNNHIGHWPVLFPGFIDQSTGDIREIIEAIAGWIVLGKGAGGSSGPGWYGETYGLCQLLFISKSLTAHTVIDIYDAFWYNASFPNVVAHPFDVVDDGHYNTLTDPVAIIEGPSQERPNTPVTFDGSYSHDPDGGPIVSYLWDFGDGTVTSTTNPTIVHTYASTGTYEVTLVVTDDESQVSAPAKHTIEIMDPAEAMQELIKTIETWNLPTGTENSLTSKLYDALHLFDQGNEVGAAHKLMDFIDQVEALRSKGKLEDWQADHLVTEAQKIIDFIKG